VQDIQNLKKYIENLKSVTKSKGRSQPTYDDINAVRTSYPHKDNINNFFKDMTFDELIALINSEGLAADDAAITAHLVVNHFDKIIADPTDVLILLTKTNDKEKVNAISNALITCKKVDGNKE